MKEENEMKQLKEKAIENKEIKNKFANILYVLIFNYENKTDKQKEKDFDKAIDRVFELSENIRVSHQSKLK